MKNNLRNTLLVIGGLLVALVLCGSVFVGGVVVGRLTAPACVCDGRSPGGVIEEEPVQALTEEPPATLESEVEAEDDPPTPAESTATATEVEGEETPAVSVSPVEDFNYELLRTALGLLEEQFYGEIPSGQTLAHGAIRGMLMTLDDPYTSFVEPEIAAIINEDAGGDFEGIGAIVTMREDGYLEVVSPIPGQPAEGAGVRAGDIILSVNDTSIVGLGLYEAISYIRGPAGTEARLEIARSGEPDPIFITVVRARIDNPNVTHEMLEDDIAYLRLTDFDADVSDKVEDALEELLAENPDGLILDLRDNPGGWMTEAIEVADLFLDKGLVAIQRDSAGNERRFSSRNGDIGEHIPMVVLINQGSASASEIVAGALQDRDRATLIGQHTLGKGSVQLPNELEDGSQLRITIARWFTPDEQDLHGNGLHPNVEVEFPVDTPAGEDPQRERAAEYLLQGE